MKRVRNRFLALGCGVLMISAGLAVAQTQPKVKSQKEADAIRAVQAATTADERLKAIDLLKGQSLFVRVLGSYPEAE